MQATIRTMLLRFPQIAGSGGLRPSSLAGWLPALFVVGCAIWTAGSAVGVYPHQLAYFNEAAGGPEHGHEHLLGSNLDWGQDSVVLEQWLADLPGSTPMRISVAVTRTGYHSARLSLIEAHSAPLFSTTAATDVRPGLYVIGANILMSPDLSIPIRRALHYGSRIAVIGGSISVIHIDKTPSVDDTLSN